MTRDDFRSSFASKVAFAKARLVERFYGAKLVKIARHIGDLVTIFDAHSSADMARLQGMLHQYSIALRPWASAAASRMIAEVAAREGKAWRVAAEAIGAGIRNEMRSVPFEEAIRGLHAEQVRLITSLPTEAASRVHRLTVEAMGNSARASRTSLEIAKDIRRTGDVTKSRAMLIARTEVGRVATTITKVRAESVGSTHFIWRTVQDEDVRDDHKVLDGKVFSWTDPPVADKRTGARALPGAIYNCRCIALPVIH